MNELELEYEDQGRASKSLQKREAQALQELGAELAELTRDQLSHLPLSDQLHEALLDALSIHAHGARKRQVKYIGGLLSRTDPAPIRAALAGLKSQSVQATRELHRVERWRDRLLAEGDAALGLLMAEYPAADGQEIRQLIRNARRELAAAKPPKSARLLFKLLRALLSGDSHGEQADLPETDQEEG